MNCYGVLKYKLLAEELDKTHWPVDLVSLGWLKRGMHRSYLENYAQIIYKVKAERSLGVNSVFSRLDSLSTVSNQSVPYQR